MAQPDSILAALREQVSCYTKLAKLAELQHEYVQRSQTEELLELLGRRQEVLIEIARLEDAVAPVKKRWQDYLAALDAPTRASAEGLMAQTRQLLEQITAADRDDAIVLQQRKLNLGRQINKVASARQINRNYAAAAYGSAAPKMDFKR